MAGKDENPSGICFLEDNKMDLFSIYTDKDILECINELKPLVIVLMLPYHYQGVVAAWKRNVNVLLEDISVE